jgi:hypothetical protein
VGVQRIAADTAESTAGMARLLRRATEVAWARSAADGPGSPWRLLAGHRSGSRGGTELSVGLDQRQGGRARPRGSCCAAAVRGQLLSRVYMAAAPARSHKLRARFVALESEANTGVGT